MGAWREEERIWSPEPGVEVEEVVPVWKEDAEPECDLCLDRGEWISPDGLVEPCPACLEREEVE